MPLSSAAKSLMALLVPFACVAELARTPPAYGAGPLAIPAQPEGWTLQSGQHGIVLTSPPGDTHDIVLFVIDKAAPLISAPGMEPAKSSITATAERFVALTESSASRLGRLTWRQGVTLEDTLLRDAVTVEDADGHTIHGYAFAYATPQGLQTLSVFWPTPLTAASPPVAQALDHVAALWRVRFSYDGTTSDISPLPPPLDTPPVTASNAPQPASNN